MKICLINFRLIQTERESGCKMDGERQTERDGQKDRQRDGYTVETVRKMDETSDL